MSSDTVYLMSLKFTASFIIITNDTDKRNRIVGNLVLHLEKKNSGNFTLGQRYFNLIHGTNTEKGLLR